MERTIRYSFQPGPSQLYPRVAYWTEVALREGLLSRYHRDPVWKALFAQAQRAVGQYLGLPEGWTVAFVSSATEAWQILADATAHLSSIHITQGEFGRRWYALQRAVSPSAAEVALSMEEPWAEEIAKLGILYSRVEHVAAVHVETSIGGWLPQIGLLRKAFPAAIIAVDATSSLGGITLPWEAIDVAFASVQKCLGLPPGMALLLISPNLAERYRSLPRQRYHSLSFLIEKAQAHEPTHTPALLHVFLLGQLLPELPPLVETERLLYQRAQWLYEEMQRLGFRLLLPEAYRSPTVLNLYWHDPSALTALRRHAEARGLYLGWGYGMHRNTAFRVANFPAIPDMAYHELINVLGQIVQA